jgi:insertion element IS1 protein InsB
MTGSEDGLRTYSVNALWRRWGVMSLLSPFDVDMDDGWLALYESRLKGKLHVISKRYTQRIERHNLNLSLCTAGTEVAVAHKIGGAA